MCKKMCKITEGPLSCRVGITGQSGFIGTHLFNTLGLEPDKYERIEFRDEYFENHGKLQEFVSSCDVIVHLAGMNRHNDPQVNMIPISIW